MKDKSCNTMQEFLAALESGEKRAAFQDEKGQWYVDQSVKEKILEIFKHSKIVDMPFGFVDKEALPVRHFTTKDQIRMVPGGSSVRRGAHVAAGVVMMPPSYINIGAFVDTGTMIDSHVLIGSCAQIGKNVHLSAAVQIGGVLEPIGHRPCIVEDNVFVGAGSILTEGIWVHKSAVVAAGVILSKSVPIFDHVKNEKYYGEIPENAVVVPGSRAMGNGMNLNCAVIVKYRDSKTNHAVALEEALR